MRTETNTQTGEVTTHPDAPSIPQIPETPAQASARKDEQVNQEFTPALLAIVNIMDSVNAATIITAAKALRKQEL